MKVTMNTPRVLSGMRPTGRLHLGHYHGVLKNWVKLQDEFTCLFFAADWHALTTNYEAPQNIAHNVWDMLIDWLSAGVDPNKAICFVQSHVLEHAELHLLLSMMSPLSWLERVPTYKDQMQKLGDKDLSTYGFLGYPLLMSADILIYRADKVPVGEDQVPHIELTREFARRFNNFYGRPADFEEKVKACLKKLGGKASKQLENYKKQFQQEGQAEALTPGRNLISEAQSLSNNDKELLLGYLEGSGKQILIEPNALLTESSKLPGLDGEKMSKSYGNTIFLRDDPVAVEKKIRAMKTDPQRMRRTDPGDPAKCPVWQFHVVYSTPETRDWVQTGCKSAGIGCLECKQPIVEAILREQNIMHERAQPYLDHPEQVREIAAHGCERARALAKETMRDVRQAMGLSE